VKEINTATSAANKLDTKFAYDHFAGLLSNRRIDIRDGYRKAVQGQSLEDGIAVFVLDLRDAAADTGRDGVTVLLENPGGLRTIPDCSAQLSVVPLAGRRLLSATPGLGFEQRGEALDSSRWAGGYE
jgi:hypothetical protein